MLSWNYKACQTPARFFRGSLALRHNTSRRNSDITCDDTFLVTITLGPYQTMKEPFYNKKCRENT